jgi:hypothetical protein
LLKVFVSTIRRMRLWCRLDLTLGRAVVVAVAAVDHPVMTKELVGHVGEVSTLTPRPKLTHG